ncbi:MAG: DUF4956 domain-containing protein [Gemmatimonadales bacterium]
MWQELKELVALPIAAACGAALAFRPVRRGTPPRDPAVIQTQIVLAIVGALIMIVVGASLARAFGIMGAASLVRYRAKISDPKDAAVMLVALAVGLAAGAGIYLRIMLATVFILAILWTLESFEPDQPKPFKLKVTGEDPTDLKAEVERLLREQQIAFELRQTGEEGLEYQLQLPPRKKTDRVANAIAAIDPSRKLTVELDADKVKK